MKIRTTFLLALTGLVVAYVRNYMLYHRSSFDSFWEFIGFWLVHYFAIGFGGVVFYAFLDPFKRLVLGKGSEAESYSMDDAIISWCLAVLICAVATFLLSQGSPTSDIESLIE